MGDKMVSNAKMITPQCAKCEYRDAEAPNRCLAFPQGIPVDILTNKVSHKKPYKGDHGIQFKEKE